MSENTSAIERRHYFRHPVDVPIQVFLGQKKEEHTLDLSKGGMAFVTNVFIESGSLLTIRIPFVSPPFEADCIVCWQQKLDGYFEIGVKFLDEETAFRVRMVEQVCHIKRYHDEQQQLGRTLTLEQSAEEWIGQHAASFGG